MSDIAIQCEGLGKRYRRGDRAPYDRLGELIAGLPRKVVQGSVNALKTLTGIKSTNTPQPSITTKQDAVIQHDWFWALRDINLEVKQGEVLGIIGRNGAGKSTLLKLLSRVAEPTTGHADLFGRVGSLLEVGTGFHPELTGRENIYLNGAVLGMTRAEINKKFDEIVDFAGVDAFLETPVKRYSSGMQTRLGFAVAAHLEPEILIVDEVLAVGDSEFQRKCLGKMDEVAQRGRTVLFVSHQLAMVDRLCTRAILMQDGQIAATGPTEQVIAQYQQQALDLAAGVPLAQRKDRSGTGSIRFEEVSIAGPLGPATTGQPLTIQARIAVPEGRIEGKVRASMTFLDARSRIKFLCGNKFSGESITALHDGESLTCHIPRLPLTPGKYFINLWCSLDSATSDVVESAVSFEVGPGLYYKTGQLPPAEKTNSMLVDYAWEVCEEVALAA